MHATHLNTIDENTEIFIPNQNILMIYSQIKAKEIHLRIIKILLVRIYL